jgi:hypothetical protein
MELHFPRSIYRIPFVQRGKEDIHALLAPLFVAFAVWRHKATR